MGIEKLKNMDDRKARKPLLERKRRARINESLAELKSIVLQSLNKDSSRYTKMEKADILEMAVKHLRALRETVSGYSSFDGTARYRDGFNHCASEMTRYVMTMDTIDHGTRSDILSHLNTTCQSVHMAISHGHTSPPLSPVVSNTLCADPHRYSFHHMIPYHVTSFVRHHNARPEHSSHDVPPTPLLPPPPPPQQYHHRASAQNQVLVCPKETSTTTKDTTRTEPVWRPW